MKKSRFSIIAFLLIFIVALLIRTVDLQSIPSGLHQDEAWFAYNTFLLLKQGTNIYNQTFPLTVDMWGDHVSAAHSYFAMPLIYVFGLTTAAFRLTTVLFSLGTLVAGSFFLHRLTKNSLIVLLFAALFALSPWNIIMARASSTVIIDTFFLILFMIFFYESITFAAAKVEDVQGRLTKYGLLLTSSYLISILCYLTYFTSRLLIIPIGLAILVVTYFQGKLYTKQIVIPAISVLILYFIFPFLFFLNTPYAQGRFKETTVVQSQAVQAALFEGIATSGLAKLPILPTRTIYNKVSENLEHFTLQYVAFFSPDTLFAQIDRPRRYTVLDTAAVTFLEYIGFLVAIGIVALGHFYCKNKSAYLALALSLFCLLCAAVPTALTIDDFPNFQRGVIMTPFWQMTAAVALYFTVSQLQWFNNLKPTKQKYTILLAVVVLSSINTLPFIFRYFLINPYYKPYYRSEPDYQLGEWINTTVQDQTILVGASDYTFLYPYLLAQENILDLPIIKQEGSKYFLSTKEFQISNRLFIQDPDLCRGNVLQEKILYLDPAFIVLRQFENNTYDQCYIPINYQPIDTINFKDGQVAFRIFERKTPMTVELQATLQASVSAKLNKPQSPARK